MVSTPGSVACGTPTVGGFPENVSFRSEKVPADGCVLDGFSDRLGAWPDSVLPFAVEQVKMLLGHRVIQVACGSRDAQTLALTDEGARAPPPRAPPRPCMPRPPLRAPPPACPAPPLRACLGRDVGGLWAKVSVP